MTPQLLSRTLHKWLTLIFGVQLVLWSLSGFYMVVVDLDFIHGDPLVHNLRTPIALEESGVAISEVANRYPGTTHAAIRALPSFDRPVYELKADGRNVLVDAQSGRQISPLSEAQIRDLARSYYAGRGELSSASLIERDPPLEIQTRPLPLWRVDFSGWLDVSLYIHPETGALVTRRHKFWRWFDFVWMLHIMDYDSRTDMNNGLLRAMTVLGGATVLSGCWLLYFSFKRRRLPAAKKAV